MFGGSRESLNQFTLVTGLDAVKIVAVNPSPERLQEIFGTDKIVLKYGVEEKTLRVEGKPDVKFKESSVIVIFESASDPSVKSIGNFNITDMPKVSAKGNKQWVNAQGIFTWGASLEDIAANERMSWYDTSQARQAYVGEEEFITLLQKFVRFSSKKADEEGTKFMKDMVTHGVSHKHLMDGDISGLENVIEYYNNEGNYLTLLFSVRKTDDGKFKQRVETKKELIYSNYWKGEESKPKVSKGFYAALEDFHNAKVAEGYKATNNLFTYKFQEFVETECVNYEPDVLGDTGFETAEDDSDDVNF